MAQLQFDQRPILVFWESTRACLLACKHCRAEASPQAAPGEMSHEEGKQFIKSLTDFGRPFPVLIITGGDVLMRDDAFELVQYARELGVPVGLAPSVTPRLTDANIQRMADLGVKIISLSLDGATSATHEGIRGVAGHFSQTVDSLKRLVAAGFTVQVNTAVMRNNVNELPAIVQILKETGVAIWEVFFLIHVGRGQSEEDLTPQENEEVCHFLYEASAYDLIVRTVEAPFFRRVVAWRKERGPAFDADASEVAARYQLGDTYMNLSTELRERLGAPISSPRAQSTGTRDGKGIIFVAHDGTVYPAGFLPYTLGNVREMALATLYREHDLLKSIRASQFTGLCGACDYRDMCGGSRARAFAASNDPLGSDSACPYVFQAEYAD